jgi:hypothetical protein
VSTLLGHLGEKYYFLGSTPLLFLYVIAAAHTRPASPITARARPALAFYCCAERSNNGKTSRSSTLMAKTVATWIVRMIFTTYWFIIPSSSHSTMWAYWHHIFTIVSTRGLFLSYVIKFDLNYNIHIKAHISLLLLFFFF